MIETSGVALPYDVQLNFWREPVSRWIGDDVTVVVVNAEQLASGRDLEGTFEDQVSSADLLAAEQDRPGARGGAAGARGAPARDRARGADPARASRRGVARAAVPAGSRGARARAARARPARGAHARGVRVRRARARAGPRGRHDPASDRGRGRAAREGLRRDRRAALRVVQGVGARIEIAPAEHRRRRPS